MLRLSLFFSFFLFPFPPHSHFHSPSLAPLRNGVSACGKMLLVCGHTRPDLVVNQSNTMYLSMFCMFKHKQAERVDASGRVPEAASRGA